MRELLLKALYLGESRIGRIGGAEENFKFRVNLLDLRNERRIGSWDRGRAAVSERRPEWLANLEAYGRAE